MRLHSALPISLLLLTLATTALGSTYVNFDVPGASGAVPTGVNKWGSVTGYYATSTAGYNGFVYQASTGVVNTFTIPGVSRTYALSINAGGWVVGYYDDKSGVHHGFLRNPKYTTLDAPGAGTMNAQGTQALSINDAGMISGVYFDSNSVEHGFVRDATGNYTSFDVSGGYAVTSAWLNEAGQVAGNYMVANNGNSSHGYVRNTDGSLTTFDPPASLGTYVAGLNSSGEATGYYYLAGGTIQEFIRDQAGNTTAFSISGYSTSAGIEDNGNAIGSSKSALTFRGWKQTATGAVSFFKDPSSGVGGTTPTCVSGNAKVAGYYFDSQGNSHTFVMH